MNEATLIFPHQLFKNNPALQAGRKIFLTEEWLFFYQYRFHKQKLLLHRASMKYYENELRKKDYDVQYISAIEPLHDIRTLIPHLYTTGICSIHYADTTDNWLEKRINESAAGSGMRIQRYPTPMFLNTPEEVNDYFDKQKKYYQTGFYTWQRKKRGILLDDNENPAGGRWTFDNENRKKLPAKLKMPPYDFSLPDMYTREAEKYINTHFPDNPGETFPPYQLRYPFAWTHDGALHLLNDFLFNRLSLFGDYEDAIKKDQPFLFHSIHSPMLNTGLLEPADVIRHTLEYAAMNPVPLNALEGFIRQVIGWREFIRIVYEREGSKQRTTNFWNFSRKIPASFWSGNTGIVPVDDVIRKTRRFGYAHHIERLMVMGNFFLLCEFDPDDVYRWFMEMYIDAYDWVMVPNVYGMTQFADGGIMTTKPYISGSNYLLKMSDWKAAPFRQTNLSWTEIWDGLFWRFLHTHRDFFQSNPRMGMLLRTLDNMKPEKRLNHLHTASEFLDNL